MMMKKTKQHISFTKMQGAGNDFVVINNLDRKFSENELIEITPQLCHRKFGIGSDGLLALFPSTDGDTDYTMFYRNPDGSDAGMCGNGARCLAYFAHNLGFDKEHSFKVNGARYQAKIRSSHQVQISFPIESSIHELQVEGRNLLQLHTGTEHLVTAVEEEELSRENVLRQLGKKLRHHNKFTPKGTNVNFICGVDNDTVRLQTYERGVEDLTLACGTGAIASALAWHHLQQAASTDQPFTVVTEGGKLLVYFSFDQEKDVYSNLKLEGPAHVVYEGTYFK